LTGNGFSQNCGTLSFVEGTKVHRSVGFRFKIAQQIIIETVKYFKEKFGPVFKLNQLL
jgi:hypothetical protein